MSKQRPTPPPSSLPSSSPSSPPPECKEESFLPTGEIPPECEESARKPPPPSPRQANSLDQADSPSSDTASASSLPSSTSDTTSAPSLPSSASLSDSSLSLPAPAATLDTFVGQLVAGRFRVIDLIGKGGMGKVYLAEQAGLGRHVALKVLHPHLAQEESKKRRFEREARAMTRFSHPGSVAVYDFGEWHYQLFIVMELLGGRSLDKILAEEFPLSTERIVFLLSQVCDVLEAAHEVGLIHRDLKPENVMVDLDREGKEQVKVVDFGLAILADTTVEQRITMEGTVVGTPSYMSPEQCQGQQLDGRSDIYALGVILYELLCGDLPFHGDTLVAIMMQHLFVEPEPPSQKRPDLSFSPPLEELALQALSKQPETRPQTVSLFRQSLQQSLSHEEEQKQVRNLLKLTDRQTRAEVLGIPAQPPQASPLLGEEGSSPIVVIERPSEASQSLSVQLRSNGYSTHPLRSVSDLFELSPFSPSLVVVDLRPAPHDLLNAIAARLDGGTLRQSPVIAVGPDDSFEVMTRSLELGLSDYIPANALSKKLPKALRRAKRRQRQRPV